MSDSSMMQQYKAAKLEYHDCLLLFRVGDFYELFYEDAKVASQELHITLTARKNKGDAESIAMCGVPHHSVMQYIAKLIAKGHKVAICDQTETPLEAKKRGYKAIVNREVTRVITPGTVLEEEMLDIRRNQYICCVFPHQTTRASNITHNQQKFTIASADITTGDVFLLTTKCLMHELWRIEPKEILLPQSQSDIIEHSNITHHFPNAVSTRADVTYSYTRCASRFKTFYGSQPHRFTKEEICALGSLLEYIQYTMKNSAIRLEFPKKHDLQQYMLVDSNTRNGLNIAKPASFGMQSNRQTIISKLDKCKSPMGSRLLARFLSYPLIEIETINLRLESVEFLHQNTQLRCNLQEIIALAPDANRLLSKLSTNRIFVKDIANVRDFLKVTYALLQQKTKMPAYLAESFNNLNGFESLLQCLTTALQDSTPSELSENDFLTTGYNKEVDHLLNIKRNSSTSIEKLRDKYRNATGVSNLKISHNNMLGYYIEVSNINASKLSNSDTFQLRQALVNNSRFYTKELQSLEYEILSCDEKLSSLLQHVKKKLADEIMESADAISLMSHNIAKIDLACTFAEIAEKYNLCKPIFNTVGTLDIKQGRHIMLDSQSNFVPNNCDMMPNDIQIITGPNMGGKSTYLRQNALIIMLAQIGCYVPAASANIPIVDKIFSRIGAGDDIATGQSTFMMEMNETAYILNNATNRSFIILDELGRGTSTYDGLSIAWATVEYIHNNIGAKTLFATHYHELSATENTLFNVHCMHATSKEIDSELVFQYKIAPGCADQSYGLHVAKLAGIPHKIITRAANILAEISGNEGQELRQHYSNTIETQDIENPNDAPETDNSAQDIATAEIIKKLHSIDLDSLTPKQSFDILYQLKNIITDLDEVS